MKQRIIDAAAVLGGNAFKLWVLMYICELTPSYILDEHLMVTNTLVNNLRKVMSEEI